MPLLGAHLPPLRWIDDQKDRMIALVEQWANINSGSDNFSGLDQMREVLKEAFGPLGDTVNEIDLPPRNNLDEHGNMRQFEVPRALSIIKRPNAPRQVFLNGHMDTVFGPNSPFQKCRRLSEDRMNGPGVADLKGGLVILLIALEALERSPFADQIGWQVFFNPDEEIGSTSSTPYFLRQAPNYDLGIIFEPQFPDGAFVSARKGAASFALVGHGRTAHAGRDFHKGINAIVALLTPLQQLQALNRPESTSTLNIGVIQGGTAINIVPDLATARFGVRASSAGDLQILIKEIQAIVDDARLKNGAEAINLSMLSHREPKPFDSATQALFTEVWKCADILNIPMQWRESGGVCDGNALASVGLPVIDSMGAAGGGIHTFDEYIDLSKLTERARHVALVLMTIASGDFALPKKE